MLNVVCMSDVHSGGVTVLCGKRQRDSVKCAEACYVCKSTCLQLSL